jgi:hypothetical protein
MPDPIERDGRSGKRRPDEAGSAKSPADADRAKANRESQEPTVGEAGGFANDPVDPTNPNEVIERHRRRLRPGKSP